MSFTHPSVFLLLLLIPVLVVGAVLASQARSKGWQKLVGSRLRHALVEPGAHARRWVSYSLALLALALLIATLTMPNAGFREEASTVRGRNLLLAIDVSRSMLAKDESPNRLTAARAAALEILELFPEDRIGLIAFSGGPWLHAPLTIDHAALVETLQQLDAETLPRGGSDLSEAVQLAIKTLKETGQQNNALIILSDGEAHDGDADQAAARAAEADLTIYTIGFGSEEGDFIPDPERADGRMRDSDGNLVFTRLKREDLQLLADQTGGFYTQGSGRQLSRSLEAAVERMDQTESEGGQRRIVIHTYQWYLLPAMVLLMLSLLVNTPWRLFRKAAVGLIALFLLPTQLEARLMPATAAEEALKEEQYVEALKLFQQESERASGERLARLKLGEGAAAYHSGNFSKALQSYSAALLSTDPAVQTEAHYALANSLYRRGTALLKDTEKPDLERAITHLTDAVAHYNQALELEPEHSQAPPNKAHVEKILEVLQQEQQQQEQQDQQNQDQENQPQDGEENPDQNQQGDGEDQPPNPQDPNQEGEQPDQGGDQDPKEGESGEEPGEGEGQEGDPDQQAEGQPGESAENQAPPQGEGGEVDGETGESPEERARRILATNADFQTAPLAQRQLKQPRTDKNW